GWAWGRGGRGRAARARERRGDRGAARAVSDRVALAGEHLVGDLDGAARDPELARERARGGKPRARGKPPGQDFGAQPLINVAIERMVRARLRGTALEVRWLLDCYWR